jgi:hypothetical protein
MGRGHDSKHDGPTIYSPQMRALQGDSFCRLCDALSQLFAECSVPCEHLTAEIPIEQLIFGIQIAKSGCKLIKFSASSSIQFNKCRASRHYQDDRENHDKRCAVLRHELSFRVRSEVAEGFSNLAPWQFSLIYSILTPLRARKGNKKPRRSGAKSVFAILAAIG